MRLSDIRPARDDAPVPAEVEAELAALDAALAGDDVPAGMEGLATLVGDLRDGRELPDTDFGDALDAWAASGFERGARPGPARATRAAGDRARGLLAALTPRRLAYAGGATATLVVVAVTVAQVDLGRDEEVPTAATLSEEAAEPEPPPPVIDEAASSAADIRADSGTAGAPLSATGPARGRETRQVERDAQLTLTAPADEVQDVTNEAIGVIETHDGIVERSQTSGTDEAARATLELLIPTRELDSTLEELSGLADVKSLSEGTVDITRPFIDARKRMQGLRAERKGLIAQIRVAQTEAELDALKLRLGTVERNLAQAEATFRNVQRRASLSNVSLEITSQGASEGDWSLEDALDDAGKVLTTAAGIALVSAAVLLPLALLAAIAYFIVTASRNRGRDRALDSN